MEYEIGTLEYYLHPGRWNWRSEVTAQPHEVVAWRKLRKGRWIAWTHYSPFYSWNNIKKWVRRRGDIYQLATANGQIITVKPKPGTV